MVFLHNLKYVIHAITIYQCLFFAIVICMRFSRRRPQNLYLAGFLLAKAVSELAGVFNHYPELHGALLKNCPQLLLAPLPFGFLYVPMLYLYTVAFTRRPPRFKTRDLLHGFPFLLVWMWLVVVYYMQGTAALVRIGASGPFLSAVTDLVLASLVALQFFCYALACLVLLARYRTRIKNSFSDIARIDLSWLRVVLYGLIGWFSILVAEYACWMLAHSRMAIFLYLFAECLFIVFTGVMAIAGMKQPELFTAAANDEPAKYHKTLLAPDMREQYKSRLLHVMKSKRPYLDSGLKLKDLAAQVGILPHHLSQVLNCCLNQNFFDFINSYRIEASKALLNTPQADGQKIAQILYATGFNSKSVFNNAFKKHTGKTPSQFARQNGMQAGASGSNTIRDMKKKGPAL
jgi:AraC-like DNA-binding protein